MLLISNRLPITVRRLGGQVSVQRSSGGLVAGLGPIHDEGDSLWIGNLGTGGVSEEELTRRRLVPVTLNREVARRHYEGYSNQVIWPLFHYLVDHVKFYGADFEAYRRVNQEFAREVVRHAKPNDEIWIHDYHLMLLPQMVREQLPNVAIGFFLHIPFPSSEVFRILPRKEEILRGLLGADLIGVHTYDYGRHLISSFRRVLGVEFDDDWVRSGDRTCKVGVFPLGVDTPTLDARARSPEVEKRYQKLRRRMMGRKVILGVDRLDYTKGVPLRLLAFRRLLQVSSKWRSQCVFMQLAVPSRSNIPSYRALKEEVDRLVGEINGAFGHEGLVPVDYMYRSVPPDDLAAMYRLADVMWVTPIRDGMNLVAKEYVAHRIEDTGVLMLSEFAGAASEMGEALLHNPWDIEGSARSLERALLMEPAEVTTHMTALRRRVWHNDVHAWVARFVEALQERAVERRRLERQTPTPGGNWIEDLLSDFRSASSRLIALDYDGTLTPLQMLPDQAAPDESLLQLLHRLGELPNTEVVVISGRDPDTLETWMDDCPVDLIAEHGLHWRLGPEKNWEVRLPHVDISWKESVREILEDYTARTPGSFVEEKSASLAWHYRRSDLSFGSWQARELTQHLSEAFAKTALEVLHGSKVVEVRPQGFNKGTALEHLIDKRGPFSFLLVAGDDRTDEDMFVHLPSGWTIKVGRAATQARHTVETPRQLREILKRLIATGASELEEP